jgi:hypothetical protein
VDGRILIDTYGYNKHHVSLHRKGGKDMDSLLARVSNSEAVVIEQPEAGRPASHNPNPNVRSGIGSLGLATTNQPASGSAVVESSSYIRRLTDADQEKNKRDMLARPGDLLFLSPKLCGYALQNKLWLNFYIDDIRPIDWNDDAYTHLVYPEEQKDLVLSFVENHQRTRQPTGPMSVDDDVIKGKGRGLILLLSGPPGTGKTLTAEAVADKTRRPLYYLQAEDLGINASVLGANIKKVFEMATEWDAVVLLDEADVFMAERNPQDIARNELVSIFLRELEYFKGIIFLTTNLYDSIDSAFRSRVNIHLLFQTLPPKSREVLWRKFLERLPPMKKKKTIAAAGADALEDTASGERGASDGAEEEEEVLVRPLDSLTEEDITELSLWELNGREIKNSIKTVKSWCDCKGYDMSLMRLESGIKVTAPQATKRGSAGDMSLYD